MSQWLLAQEPGEAVTTVLAEETGEPMAVFFGLFSKYSVCCLSATAGSGQPLQKMVYVHIKKVIQKAQLFQLLKHSVKIPLSSLILVKLLSLAQYCNLLGLRVCAHRTNSTDHGGGG